MASLRLPLTIGEVLSEVGCPVVEIACDEPVDAIARLITFTGLTAVLIVRPCGAPARIVSARDVMMSLIDAFPPGPDPDRLPRCKPEDGFVHVTGALFGTDQSAVLVECGGVRLALITADSLANYLVTRRRSPG